MFVGELMCLFVYFGKTLLCKPKMPDDDEEETPASPGTKLAKKTKLKTKINPFLLAIPATFDICASTLMFMALTQCAASIYQMMRGFIVVITAAMARIFLGKKQYMHHYVSLLLIVFAVALVGLVGVMHSDSSEESGEATTTPFGILLLIIS